MYISMFQSGHSRGEVIDQVKQDYKHDSRSMKVIDFVFCACLFYLVHNHPPLDALAIVGAAGAGITGMRVFVDQTARNFYLHRIDWESAKSDESGR